MLWRCFAFRWRKGHFKKSPRSKSPAAMEHNRAVENMQRSYRRYKLPRTVSTFSLRIAATERDTCRTVYSLPCTMSSCPLFYLNSTAIPCCRSDDNAHYTDEKINIQKRRWLVKAHPVAMCRRWDLNWDLSNIKSHVLHCSTLALLYIKLNLAKCIYLTVIYWDLLCVKHSSKENRQKSLPSWSYQSSF